MDDPQYDLYFQVLQTLENLQIAYVIIGAFAGVSYGVTRTTYDIDIVVDLKPNQIEALTEAFPPPRYYADSHQISESIRFGILFNIIDTSVASKVDDPDISENFDFNYINNWTTAVGGEIEQFWVYLQHLSKLHLE